MESATLLENSHWGYLATIGLFALIFMCATAIGAVTYNVFFHPLARFPGPRFAATTRLVKHFKAIQGVQHKWIKEQHDRYGPVVRIGPNILSYTNPEAQKEICGHRTATHKANLKDFKFFAKEVNGVPSLVSIEDHEEHGRVRRIFSNAFSDKALKEQEPLIRKYADKLVAALTNQVAAGKTPDIVKMYNCATFDVMGDLCFGQSLGLLEDSEYSPWVKAIFEGFKALQLAGASRDYPFFAPLLDLLIPRSLQKKRQDHFQYSADRVNKRLNANTDRPDIWTLVLRHQEKGNGLSMAQMHSNASLFMVAGTETTATLLSGLTDLLLKHPDKLAILTAEIRNSVTSTDELTINNLQRLTYLQACLSEGLRLYPPTPLGSPRIVPEGGNVICNEFLPAGTNICVNYWAAFRCADNFYRPEAFLPERWLPEPPYEFANDKRDVMQPFSVGPYACLGKNLAYHEMRLILAKVLYNFDLVPYAADESKMDRDWSDHKVPDPSDLKTIRRKFHRCLRKRATKCAESIKWAFYKREHFRKFVNDISALVDALEHVFPEDTREKLRELSQQECKDLSKANLEELKRIVKDYDPWLNIAVDEELKHVPGRPSYYITQSNVQGTATGVHNGNSEQNNYWGSTADITAKGGHTA